MLKYFVVQRKYNLAPTVERNSHCSAVGVSPALVTARLPHFYKAQPVATRRNSSARALGMRDLSRVRGHWRAFVAVIGFNHRKHFLEFGERLCSSGPERIAARKRRNLRNPAGRLIAIKHHLLVIQAHAPFPFYARLWLNLFSPTTLFNYCASWPANVPQLLRSVP